MSASPQVPRPLRWSRTSSVDEHRQSPSCLIPPRDFACGRDASRTRRRSRPVLPLTEAVSYGRHLSGFALRARTHRVLWKLKMPDPAWSLHSRLKEDTIDIGDLPLSKVLVIKDAHYPWLLLVPRRAD